MKKLMLVLILASAMAWASQPHPPHVVQLSEGGIHGLEASR